MPNLLFELEVNRVDLVDEGCNSEAFIKLYKRKENTMTLQEILEKGKPELTEVITSEIAKAKAEIPEGVTVELEKAKADLSLSTEELAKAKADLSLSTEELAKAKADVKTMEDELAAAKAKSEDINKSKELSEEEVLKSLDPTVQEIFKSIKAQKLAAEEIVKSLQAQKLNDEAIVKAKELKNLPVDQDKLVDIAKSASDEIYEVLKAANKALENAGIFKEVGKGGNGDDIAGTAWEKIAKKAEVLAETEKVTIQKATARIIKENPELYREYLNGGMN
jgi:hypothetical protein